MPVNLASEFPKTTSLNLIASPGELRKPRQRSYLSMRQNDRDSQTAVLEWSSAVKMNTPSSSSSRSLDAGFDRKFCAQVKEPDLVYVAQPGPLILSDGSMKGMTKPGAHHYLTSDTHAL